MSDFTIISTADWDHPLWTNKQHVALSLQQLGHRILYVESLGLRVPRKQANDWKRIVKRLKSTFRKPRQVQPNLWVWSPLVIPGAGSFTILRLINRLVFSTALRRAENSLRISDATLWTYNPCTLDYIESTSQYRQIVYHCVDDIQSQPGMNKSWIDRQERRLCSSADIVFVTSPGLLKTRSSRARRIKLYPNVVDYDHFSKAARLRKSNKESILDNMPSPRLGFIGALSAYKVNLGLIADLARQKSEWSFILIGPTGEGEEAIDLSELLRLPNIRWLGVQSYSSLPSLMSSLDVALIPLQRNQYTESMFPMKFFEYLAARLPVVGTPIRSLKEFADAIFFLIQRIP